MQRAAVANILFAAAICLLPLVGVPSRLLHPAPWIAFVAGLLTMLTQPPLTPTKVVTDQSDRLSALAILIGVAGSQLVAVVQFGYRTELVPPALSGATVLGAVLVTCGLGLRIWSIRTLGEFFTSTVHVAERQPVIATGPYRRLRHPSYTGTILHITGVAIATASSLAALVVLLVAIPAYLHRISVEETALLAGIGDPYREYRRRTWRLVPMIY